MYAKICIALVDAVRVLSSEDNLDNLATRELPYVTTGYYRMSDLATWLPLFTQPRAHLFDALCTVSTCLQILVVS